MTENQQIKIQYVKDADLMATKSRFGFFSILPSHTAAITDYSQKKAKKDQDGRAKIGPRGIFSGSKSTKVLSKTCFSQIVSPFVGCPYQDPGRAQRKRVLEQKKKWTDKQIFKPAKLNKTLVSASYQYKCVKPLDKAKMFRTDDGRVITQSPNICSNPLSKLTYQRLKKFQYKEDPYDNLRKSKKQELDKNISLRGAQPFKGGNPGKQFFESNPKIFDDTSNILKSSDKGQQKKETKSKISHQIVNHQSNFRPSSGAFTRYNGLFNKITYTQQKAQETKRPKTCQSMGRQAFKLMKKQKDSKPCPSICYSKMNLLKCVR